jgi:hypothetical protein
VSQSRATERNIELSRRAVDAWNRQHVETIIELTDPACTWQPAIEATADRTWRDGRATAVTGHLDQAEALAAAGSSG